MITISEFEHAFKQASEPLLRGPVGHCEMRFLDLPCKESAIEMANLGFLGMYPIAQIAKGDWIALSPRHGQPLLSWPALLIDPNGGSAQTLSTFRGLVRGLLAVLEIDELRWLDLSDLKSLLPGYRSLASFLGDERLVNDAVLRLSTTMSRGGGLSKRGSPQENMALAAPDSPGADYIEAVHKVRFHSKDPIAAYTDVLRRHPRHRMTLAAMAKSAKKNNKMSIRNGAMLGLLKGHNGVDNDPAESTPEVLSLSLFNLKQTQKLNNTTYAPLIQRKDNDFGRGYFEVGRTLHRGGKPKSALVAYQNAFYWSVKGFGACEIDALDAAMDCAAYLDPDIHTALKLSAGFKDHWIQRRDAEAKAKAAEKATYWLKFID